MNRMLCEREMVSTTKNKMKSVRPPYMSGEEEFHAYNAVSPLANGYKVLFNFHREHRSPGA